MLNHLSHVVMFSIIHTYALSVWEHTCKQDLCSIQYAIEELRQQLHESVQAQEDIKAEARQVCYTSRILTLKEEVLLQDIQPFTHHNLRRMQLRRKVAESLKRLPLCRHTRIRSHS